MNKKRSVYAYIIIFSVLGRLIPHPANFTPNINISLFAGNKLPKTAALFIALVSLLISDIVLAYIYNYPIFGYWTLFSYSGFAAIVLIGSKINQNGTKYNLLLYVVASSLGYWIWTNFGAWLLTSAYAKSLTGLLACYTMAIPFLRNALLGDLCWMVIIFCSYRWLYKRKGYKQWQPHC